MKLVHTGIILGLAVAGAAAVACSGSKTLSTGSDIPASNSPSSTDFGSLRGAITVGSAQVNSVSWTITSTDTSVDGGLYATDASSVSGNTWSGTVDVSHSGNTEFTLGRLPASVSANDYSVALSATTVDGAYKCAGSATFSIATAATTNLNISNFVCTPAALQAGSGDVFISATMQMLNGCTALTGVSATPEDIIIPIDGGAATPVYLSASAVQNGIGSLAYSWWVDGPPTSVGTINQVTPTAANNNANITFTCKQPGTVNLAVTSYTANADDAGVLQGSTNVAGCPQSNSQAIRIDCEGACTQTVCGASCVTTSTDLNNCGTCANVCPAAPANSVEACTAGVCGFTCNAGFTKTATACVDLQTDNNNCGTVGHVCAAGSTCTAGVCVSAPKTVQVLCDAYIAANAATFLPRYSTCSATEVALYAHDANTANAGACLACAYSNGLIDDTFLPTDNTTECQDRTFTAGTAASCVAELACGLGLPATCTPSSVPSGCVATTTSIKQSNGIAVNNLFCGNLSAPNCNGQTPASGAPGTCVAAWLGGVSPADATGSGAVALGDGSKLASAAGGANSLLTGLNGNCQNACLIQ